MQEQAVDMPGREIPLPLPVGLFSFFPFAFLPSASICMAVLKLRMAAHRAGSSVFYQGEAAWDKEGALG